MVSLTVGRRARTLRYLLVLAMLNLFMANAWLWWHGAGSYGTGWVSIRSEWPVAYPGPAWAPLVAASLASAVLLVGMYRLCRVMRSFEAGDFFSVAATRHLRAFALSLIGAVTVSALVPPLFSLERRLAGAADVQAISLQMDASDVGMLLAGSLFFLVTSLMVEGRRLADDNERII